MKTIFSLEKSSVNTVSSTIVFLTIPEHLLFQGTYVFIPCGLSGIPGRSAFVNDLKDVVLNKQE